MVHVSLENKILVVGAFYKIGHRPDRFLSQVISHSKFFQFNVLWFHNFHCCSKSNQQVLTNNVSENSG